jgi:hypothetical protein
MKFRFCMCKTCRSFYNIAIAALVLLLLSLLFSCTPEKRLARLVKKHPHLKTTDTIVYRDTITLPAHTKDTSFKFHGDTIVLRDSVFIIKYFYNKQTNEHYIKGERVQDTLYIEKKIPFEKIVVKQDPLTFWDRNYPLIISFLIGLLLALLLLIWILLFRRKAE